MVFAVEQRCFEVDHRISCKDAVFDCFAQAFFDCGNELFGDCAADDSVDEFKIAVCRARLELNVDNAELTCAARLFLMFASGFGGFADGFAICDFRVSEFRLDSEFIFKTRTNDLELRFAKSAH